MPEPTTEGAMPNPEPTKGQEQQPKTEAAKVEEKVTDNVEELKKQLFNKTEEATRLHKKVEKFEADDEARKQASLSETEKLTQRATKAEQEAAELKTKQAQRDAAEKVGLPNVFADRIKGATPEEMEADAKALLEAMPKGTVRKPPPPPSSPADGAPTQTTDDERRKFLFGRQS